jgi:hypothetical protein
MRLATLILFSALATHGLTGRMATFAVPIISNCQNEPAQAPQGAVPPSEQPVKTENPQPQAGPSATPQATPPSEPTVQAEQASAAPAATEKTTPAQKCRKSKSGKCLKRVAAGGPPKKIVVRDGSTSEPTSKLAPTVPTNIASQQAVVTEQLLTAAETNLKQATTRQLNTDQSAVVEQIRNYIAQARSAIKAGDMQRGHNLAVKARLLSDDLVAP